MFLTVVPLVVQIGITKIFIFQILYLIPNQILRVSGIV